jgi:hypothetical protein
VARENLTQLLLYAVALALGISSAVLSILATLSIIPALEFTTIGVLLGIAVFCLGLAGLDSLE